MEFKHIKEKYRLTMLFPIAKGNFSSSDLKKLNHYTTLDSQIPHVKPRVKLAKTTHESLYADQSRATQSVFPTIHRLPLLSHFFST